MKKKLYIIASTLEGDHVFIYSKDSLISQTSWGLATCIAASYLWSQSRDRAARREPRGFIHPARWHNADRSLCLGRIPILEIPRFRWPDLLCHESPSHDMIAAPPPPILVPGLLWLLSSASLDKSVILVPINRHASLDGLCMQKRERMCELCRGCFPFAPFLMSFGIYAFAPIARVPSAFPPPTWSACWKHLFFASRRWSFRAVLEWRIDRGTRLQKLV